MSKFETVVDEAEDYIDVRRNVCLSTPDQRPRSEELSKKNNNISLVEESISISVSDWSWNALDTGDEPTRSNPLPKANIVSSSDEDSLLGQRCWSPQPSKIDESVSSIFEQLSLGRIVSPQASSLCFVECSDDESMRESCPKQGSTTISIHTNDEFCDGPTGNVVSSSDDENVSFNISEWTKSNQLTPNRFLVPEQSGSSLGDESCDGILPPTPTPDTAKSFVCPKIFDKSTALQSERSLNQVLSDSLVEQKSLEDALFQLQPFQEVATNYSDLDGTTEGTIEKEVNTELNEDSTDQESSIECQPHQAEVTPKLDSTDVQSIEDSINSECNSESLNVLIPPVTVRLEPPTVDATHHFERGSAVNSSLPETTPHRHFQEDGAQTISEMLNVVTPTLLQPLEDPEEIVRVICDVSKECLHDSEDKPAPKILQAPRVQNFPDHQFLLDFIAAECDSYARAMFEAEPVNGLFDRLTKLTVDEKAVFEDCILQMARKGVHWVKYEEFLYEGSESIIDRLVSYDLLKYYVPSSSNMASLVPMLSFTEIANVCLLHGQAPSADFNGMRATVLRSIKAHKLTSEAIEAIVDAGMRIVALPHPTRLAVNMCFEMFALPWQSTDKFYDSSDAILTVEKFIKKLKSGKIRLVPTNLTDIEVCSGQNYRQFYELCDLKLELAERRCAGEDLSTVADSIGSSIAVFDVTSNGGLNYPLTKFLMTNLVYMTDEVLKEFFATNPTQDESSHLNAGFYLSILLKQNFAGFDRRAVWCKKELKCTDESSKRHFEVLLGILEPEVSTVESIVRSEAVAQMLGKKKTRLSGEERSTIDKLMRPVQHIQVQILNDRGDNEVTVFGGPYRSVSTNRTMPVRRSCLLREYGKTYPRGVQDGGLLLTNSIILAFWDIIYCQLPETFFSRYQIGPVDWGSPIFYNKRQSRLQYHISKILRQLPLELINDIELVIDRYSNCRSLVHWKVVAHNLPEMRSLLEALGTQQFAAIAAYLLESWDERVVGFPDLTLWNPSTGGLKFVGTKKTSDPVYPHQVIWLEKLALFGLDAEECQIVTKIKATPIKKKPLSQKRTTAS